MGVSAVSLKRLVSSSLRWLLLKLKKISAALMPSNPKTVVITTPGEIAAFYSLPPLDLLKLRSPAALSPTVPSLTA